MKSFREKISTQIRLSNTLQRLLILNVALFVLIRVINSVSTLFLNPVLSFGDVSNYLAIRSNISEFILRPWTIFTYMFFHWDFMHLLFNMLWLYWMGKIFQEYLGNKKLLNTYIVGGLAGALFFVAAYNIFPVFSDSVGAAFALGASASVLAITIATATLLPEYPIQLIFFGTIPLKWIALVSILLDLISVSGSNAGGHIAHLGGALYGFIYIKQLKKGKDISAWLTKFFDLFAPRKKMKVTYRQKKPDVSFNVNKKARQEKMDEILDKISKSGYGSLSQEEKDFLFTMSKEN